MIGPILTVAAIAAIAFLGRPRWWVHVAYIALALIVVLQIGHQREEMGYYKARLTECGKIVNSDNYAYADANMITPPSIDERWNMKRRCEAAASESVMRSGGWFWSEGDHDAARHYNELWHY